MNNVNRKISKIIISSKRNYFENKFTIASDPNFFLNRIFHVSVFNNQIHVS